MRIAVSLTLSVGAVFIGARYWHAVVGSDGRTLEQIVGDWVIYTVMAAVAFPISLPILISSLIVWALGRNYLRIKNSGLWALAYFAVLFAVWVVYVGVVLQPGTTA